jgi:CheY-like chemotaxis protein
MVKRVPAKRVLVLDDDAAVVKSLVRLLGAEGYTALGVQDGTDALAQADSFLPDVAILDLNMPGMSGLQVYRQLRMKPWAATLRVIALSGRGLNKDEQAAFDAHFAKPIDWDALRRELCR